MSSCHLLLGRPLDLFPLLGCHSVHRLVHLLSFNLAIWPAHFHFCFSVYSMISMIFVLFLISAHGILSFSFRSNIFHSKPEYWYRIHHCCYYSHYNSAPIITTMNKNNTAKYNSTISNILLIVQQADPTCTVTRQLNNKRKIHDTAQPPSARGQISCKCLTQFKPFWSLVHLLTETIKQWICIRYTCKHGGFFLLLNIPGIYETYLGDRSVPFPVPVCDHLPEQRKARANEINEAGGCCMAEDDCLLTGKWQTKHYTAKSFSADECADCVCQVQYWSMMYTENGQSHRG